MSDAHFSGSVFATPGVADITHRWKKYTVTLTSDPNDPNPNGNSLR
jgi:hypothetical protein